MILVIVDAHYKWIEAIPTISRVVVAELRFLFSQFGLPECIVSDNGTCFTSHEFKEFLKRHGINHIFSVPYHPASNGLAEQAVQVVKRGLRKMSKGLMQTRITTILFHYQLTTQSTTGMAPSEFMLGRTPRSHLCRSVETKHSWTGGMATGYASVKTQCTCQWTKLWTRRVSVCQELSARKMLVTWCGTGKDRTCFISSQEENWVDVTWIKYVAGPWKNCQRQRFLIHWLMSCLMYLLTHQLKLLGRLRRLVHQMKALLMWIVLKCLIRTMCRNCQLPLKFILLALVNLSIGLNQLGHRQWTIVVKFTSLLLHVMSLYRYLGTCYKKTLFSLSQISEQCMCHWTWVLSCEWILSWDTTKGKHMVVN